MDVKRNNSVTYVFNAQNNAMCMGAASWDARKNVIWKFLPSVGASLTCVSFGLMLGWPSPTYPALLEPDSRIKITMPQSAMITGFLMLGVSIGTPLSSKRIVHGPKYGIILGNCLMVLGWILMWQAKSVLWLLASRIILGLGHGFAMGQIKIYIKEMCDESLASSFSKQLNLYAFFGLVIAFVIGPFVDFKQFSLVSLVISVVILFVTIFLPCTPRELIELNKIKDAQNLLQFLKPDANVEQETDKILYSLGVKTEENGFIKIIRNPTLRINFVKFSLLIFCQQFSGAPPTLVYTQILFRESLVPSPEYVAIGYAILFFISNVVGIYVTPKYNKKTVLVISSISVSILSVCNILVIFYKINHKFPYASVIVLYLFIFVHTVGLGSIPLTLINDLFPKSYRLFVTKCFIVYISMFALIVTKIFQVLVTEYRLETPFYLFLAVSVMAAVHVLIFIPNDELALKESSGLYQINITHSINNAQFKK
ncbi:uncharacterized protein LOC132699894 isoform X2 [Cylas formicarius]|uniref:uncharacterized protein LOC132699894 isoform X2 n=1 Tax=Cylas formicarius TaxID=197179 RepID=UPI0029586453|nr:uncharacterized protein LOC132699894 isoform X2 [Cylas formicarius]